MKVIIYQYVGTAMHQTINFTKPFTACWEHHIIQTLLKLTIWMSNRLESILNPGRQHNQMKCKGVIWFISLQCIIISQTHWQEADFSIPEHSCSYSCLTQLLITKHNNYACHLLFRCTYLATSSFIPFSMSVQCSKQQKQLLVSQLIS